MPRAGEPDVLHIRSIANIVPGGRTWAFWPPRALRWKQGARDWCVRRAARVIAGHPVGRSTFTLAAGGTVRVPAAAGKAPTALRGTDDSPHRSDFFCFRSRSATRGSAILPRNGGLFGLARRILHAANQPLPARAGPAGCRARPWRARDAGHPATGGDLEPAAPLQSHLQALLRHL